MYNYPSPRRPRDPIARARSDLVLALSAIVAPVAAATLSRAVWGDWFRPGSTAGLVFGLAAAQLVLFAMLFLFRKRFRGYRFGATGFWLRLHIWAGVASVPLVILHCSAARFSPFGAALTALFAVVIVSGFWGRALKHFVIAKLNTAVPDESATWDARHQGEFLARRASRAVASLLSARLDDAVPLVTGPLAAELVAFRDEMLLPFLLNGPAAPLADSGRARTMFDRLRGAVPAAALPAIDDLERCWNLRRRWDRQAVLLLWLDNWTLIHTPLAFALTGLIVIHAARELRYW